MGQYLRVLEFTPDGRYTVMHEFRGTYAQLPADSVGSISHEYGTYLLTGNTLHFYEDSVRTWDYMTGSSLHTGPRGVYIEGPPTDPTIELTRTRLTLRYSVNPGAGYVQVTDMYDRDR